ncbi:C-reactive protein-like isoform X2 [Capricornis sumatraensis]|uniref:C-reactive protein-like isoform X2 n=1 Tax=Capricornis sumatraensis TaxID=34865 RepID=UPI003604D3A7
MERLLCFLALIGFSRVLGQTDLHKKAFVFPKETENSYVSLRTQLETPLKAFTVCLYFYTELARTRKINTVYVGGNLSPNVLNWKALNYEAKGEVFVKPQLW